MSSSSSSSDVVDDPPSSPPAAQDYGSYDEHSSPPTSDSESVPKRGRYGLYNKDPTVQVPRETQRRWNLSITGQVLGTSNTALNSGPSILQTSFETSQDSTKYESDSDTEPCEVGSSTSEQEFELNSTDDSGETCSAENSTSPECSDGSSDGSASPNSGGAVSDDSDNQPLFSGSDKTTDEAVLEVCNLFLKHRWTKASLNDTLKLLASTLPKENNMPHSLHTLYKYVNLSAAPCFEVCHFYCSKCFQLKIAKSDVCENCSLGETEGNLDEPQDNLEEPQGNSDLTGVFYSFSVEDQIRYMFEKNNLAEAMDDFRSVRSGSIDPEKDDICDILDGSEYKRVKRYAKGPYDITLLWNTDGVSLSASSQIKFFPILSTVCEVAPRLRSFYIMVNSIWVDASAPHLNFYCKPFVDELQQINEAGGVEWKHPKSGEMFKSQVFAPLFIGDAPVRGDMLNVMRYNAIYSCEKCEQKASKLPPKDGIGRSVRRLVFTEDPATERTSERMRLQADCAKSKQKQHVKGVKGRSVIENIPHLDRSKCTLAEYMHSVALGVTRHFSELWFYKPGPWFIGKSKKAVDTFLTSIKVLDFMRKARKVSEISYFKASEFRSWLLYFSLIALQEVGFPNEYYQHWILSVKSVYILLQDRISQSDLLSAETMLRCFSRDVGKLYTDYDYVYNVHQLLHLTTYVKEWGPLSANSAFLFEGYNGVLSRLVHGTKHQAKELTENLKLARCIHVLATKVKNSSDVDQVSDFAASVLGKAGRVILTPSDIEILRGEGLTEFETYRRASFKRVTYTCCDYDSKRKKCNSIIEFIHESRTCTGEIICFIETPDTTLCYVEKYKVRQVDIIFHRETMQKISHLLPVE